MEECIRNVKLFGSPVVRSSDGENSMNGGGFDNRGKGFIKIDPSALSKAANDPPCFKRSNDPSDLSLCLKTHFPVTT